jgi:NAD(P)-dependent dehydrogenase (short-subunit alcohol dehydrogenase family)
VAQGGPDSWDVTQIGDLSGKVALVTGATSGIGLGAAKVLAAHRATVVIAARNTEKAAGAAAAIKAATVGATVDVLVLDLASLAAVRSAARDFKSRYERLDLLINNAGVMVPPYGTTVDGFELQFGTNHLGHFALTGLLLGMVTTSPGSRIITVSSGAHRQGIINFDDLQSQRRYRAVTAYGQSKLANLLFTYELQRRLTANGSHTIAVAAHPGWARTELQRHAALNWWWKAAAWVEPMFSQSADEGAVPTLRAATDPAVNGGEYYGPSGFMEGKGRPVRVDSNARSHDVDVQKRLWAVSEELTGVSYANFPGQ